jgi:hypothetical protein
VSTTATQTLTNKTLTTPAITNPTGLDKNDVGLDQVDNTSDINKPISTATQSALDAKADDSALTSHVGDTGNPHSVTAAQVGLGNVSNVATDDTPYDATTWNTNSDAATKNAIRDKIETMDTAIAANSAKVSADGSVTTPMFPMLAVGRSSQEPSGQQLATIQRIYRII